MIGNIEKIRITALLMISWTWFFTWRSESLKGYFYLYFYLSVFLSVCFSFCPSVFLFVCSSVCLSICSSIGHLHKCLNNNYNNWLDTDTSLSCIVMKWFISIKENWKFDLTTFGFNDHKSPVPSRSLNRVPTVLLNALR